MDKRLWIVYIGFFVVFFLSKIGVDYFLFHEMNQLSLLKSLLMSIIATALYFFLMRKQFMNLKK